MFGVADLVTPSLGSLIVVSGADALTVLVLWSVLDGSTQVRTALLFLNCPLKLVATLLTITSYRISIFSSALLSLLALTTSPSVKVEVLPELVIAGLVGSLQAELKLAPSEVVTSVGLRLVMELHLTKINPVSSVSVILSPEILPSGATTVSL